MKSSGTKDGMGLLKVKYEKYGTMNVMNKESKILAENQVILCDSETYQTV